MTTKRSTYDTPADQWATTYASEERRRKIVIGLVAFVVLALFVAAIVSQFGGGAAFGW